MLFRYIDDVIDWLEPLDYESFWDEVGPYALVLQPRAHCDHQIARGLANEETVLCVLKHMARTELSQIFRLDWANTLPYMALH